MPTLPARERPWLGCLNSADACPTRQIEEWRLATHWSPLDCKRAKGGDGRVDEPRKTDSKGLEISRLRVGSAPSAASTLGRRLDGQLHPDLESSPLGACSHCRMLKRCCLVSRSVWLCCARSFSMVVRRLVVVRVPSRRLAHRQRRQRQPTCSRWAAWRVETGGKERS
jgi:hypothetical protein